MKSLKLVLVLFLGIFVMGCSQQNELVGTWQARGKYRGSTTFTKNTYIMEMLGARDRGTYKVKESWITFTDINGNKEEVQFEIKGDTLLLYGITWVRVGTSGGRGIGSAEPVNSFDLTLPKGYKDVLGAWEYVAVIVNDTVQFYEYDYDDEKWTVDSRLEMVLPRGYKEVFFSNFWDDVIGVVLNNKVQFYEYDSSTWSVIPEMEMTLPKGYKKVFFCGLGIGVLLNNKVQFYNYDGETWSPVSAD
jgi:hypothetical protein